MTDREKLEFLFEEIGELDESILYECTEIYPAARKRKRIFRTAILAAAALMLSVTLLLSSLLLSSLAVPKLLGLFFQKGSESPTDPSAGISSEISEPDEERFLLEEQVEELLFADRPSVIFSTEDRKGYKYAFLSAEEFNRISDYMKTPERKTNDGETDGEDSDVKVWICDGHGKVMSPYLEKTKGNMGYGILFDYEQEVVPNRNLLGLLESKLSFDPSSEVSS